MKNTLSEKIGEAIDERLGKLKLILKQHRERIKREEETTQKHQEALKDMENLNSSFLHSTAFPNNTLRSATAFSSPMIVQQRQSMFASRGVHTPHFGGPDIFNAPSFGRLADQTVVENAEIKFQLTRNIKLEQTCS